MVRGSGRKTRTPGTFGTVQQLPSGRYRALYFGPDGRRYSAPTTFIAKQDARGWLALRHSEIIRDAWVPPGTGAKPDVRRKFNDFANEWLEDRANDAAAPLKQRTAEHYRLILDRQLLPTFGQRPVASITADDVKAWYRKTGAGAPTMRAHSYGLLRTIMAAAVAGKCITENPCAIRGAGSAKRVHEVEPATLEQLDLLTDAMPGKFRLMILLASWCALRFGELTELRRVDIDLSVGAIKVRRGVVRVSTGFKVEGPKSKAGIRTVAIPPHLLPMVEEHLGEYVEDPPNSLLFPASNGGHLAPSTLYRHFYKARDAAGRPDLRFHDLRHTGAVLAALTGATLADLMNRLGHSSHQAALIYQHRAQGRDRVIADALSAMTAPKALAIASEG
ncbi:tyrosine-type recombinase/integrase [Mycolicibacterium neoaurum]|uniref:tyrosine-type recombinase/integrase n=1 Tax=Mycolicibacterium neoaurum TaxID=1795 RepID=UPI0004EF78CA|nr:MULTISPECIES: site-specific integrase [Mycobacteriaceae]AHC25324.2 integrase [Mycolicibacterium neoaurum VKM Ac-1815D]AMO05800.1 integrase [Mycolicibacterium neoaurum]KJQ49348.1 integrase [Mycolicibacterium neoaurum]KUM08985.1 integrase [Mycolicibacterium neoaurum]